MKLKFTKMHGLGNDFVVINAMDQAVRLTPERIRQWADRHRGIGYDQLLLVERPSSEAADFRYRIFNADGGEVEQCGNGARCFARFVYDTGLTSQREIRVETARGIIVPRLETNGLVSVDMGAPRFLPQDIPFLADAPALTYPLDLGQCTVTVSVLSMGNPHAIQRVEDVGIAPVAVQGPLIERHARFPQRVNAGFMQVLDAHHIRLRVYERGSGETLACGTGACAAAVAGIRLGWLESPVHVATRGGELTIRWQGDTTPVMMTGPATPVFTGEIPL